jgi:hypothetical protein
MDVSNNRNIHQSSLTVHHYSEDGTPKTKDKMSKQQSKMHNETSTPSKSLSGKGKLEQPPISSKVKKAASRFNSIAKAPISSKKFPISQGQIAAQAKLHQTKRQSKAYASQQETLTPMGDSANAVFKLGKERGYGGTEGKPTTYGKTASQIAAEKSSLKEPAAVGAFFKVGNKDEKAAGTMEKMMWDFACILGLEAHFVPTGTVDIYYDQAGGPTPEIDRRLREGETKERKAGVWDAAGRIVETSDAAKVKQGGIQPAQQGTVLGKWRDSDPAHRPPIAQEEISRTIVTSLVFGMFDAHANNIFVTDEGTLKFFDNTRSMPHSNGWIDRGNHLVSSYRCALLDMNGSRHVLTPEEKEQVKNQIEDVAAKMEDFEKYMDFVEESAESLPFGWLDTKAALSAMQSRVDRMRTAIDDPKVNTLLDLSMRTIDGYKMSVVLQYIKDLAEADDNGEKLPSEPLHGAIGYTSLEDLFAILESKHINAREVIDFCERENDYDNLLNGALEIYEHAENFWNQLENDRQHTEEVIADLHKTIEQYDRDLERIKDGYFDDVETTAFNKVISELKKEIVIIEKDVSHAESEIEEKRSQIERNKDKAELLQSNIDDLSFQLDHFKYKKGEGETELTELNEALVKYVDDERTLDRIRDLKEELVEYDTEIKALNPQLILLKREKITITKANIEINSEIKKLQSTVKEKNSEIALLKEDKLKIIEKTVLDAIDEVEDDLEKKQKQLQYLIEDSDNNWLLDDLKDHANIDLKDKDREFCEKIKQRISYKLFY